MGSGDFFIRFSARALCLGLAVRAVMPCAWAEAPYFESAHVDVDEDGNNFVTPTAYGGCPRAFISRYTHKDQTDVTYLGWFWGKEMQIPVAQTCDNLMKQYGKNLPNSFSGADDLEPYLNSDSVTQIPGSATNLQKGGFITNCLHDKNVLKASGVDRPLTPKEEKQIVSDWYFTSSRIRDGWHVNAEGIKSANAILGLEPSDGIQCSDLKIPGSCADLKEIVGCGADPKALDKLVAGVQKQLSTLDQDALKIYQAEEDQLHKGCGSMSFSPVKGAASSAAATPAAQCMVLSGNALKTARLLALAKIPYHNEGEMKKLIEQLADGKKVSSDQLKAAYLRDLAAVKDASEKRLKNMERASTCINGGDPLCFTDSWWQKPAKILGGNKDDAETVLGDMPAFNFSGFLDGMPKGNTDKQKLISAGAQMTAAQCMGDLRKAFDLAKVTEDEQGVQTGAMVLGAAVKFAASGMNMDKAFAWWMNFTRPVTPPMVARIFGVAVDAKYIPKTVLVNSKWFVNSPLVTATTGSAPMRAALMATGIGVEDFWMAMGPVFAVDACHKVAESIGNKIQNHLTGTCKRDFVGETLGWMEYSSCAVASLMPLIPAVSHALTSAGGKPAQKEVLARYIGRAVSNKSGESAAATEGAHLGSLPPANNSSEIAAPASKVTRPKKGLPYAEDLSRSTNPYYVLGVKPGTTDAQAIQKAYDARVAAYGKSRFSKIQVYLTALSRLQAARDYLLTRAMSVNGQLPK